MSGKSSTTTTPESDDLARVWWVEVLRWIALAVFIIVPIFAFLVQSLAGRIVWTVVVAALPFFIVLVGYHRWRRICPLAFFAQIPVKIRRPGTRRASKWSESNYYLIAFSVFVFSLWIRLIATNGNGRAISVFFVVLALAALTIGAFYTGKTWCNYICPVSFVEKIYTEPHSLRQTENSQCEKCSACKKFCPDINEENGYWKEIGLSSKRWIYFAFPGVVFAFYFYYYLQAGAWEYYFSGRWTNEPSVLATAFLPGQKGANAGFFFLPIVPRALAAAITLLIFACLSFTVFSILERLVAGWLRRRDSATDPNQSRHVMFSLAGFSAFVIFYSFAGQPSLRKITFLPAPQLMSIAVVATATIFLIKRLRRTSRDFAEETLARSIIRRWEWPDMVPPKDPHEAFLVHTARSRASANESAKTLEVYEASVREALTNGFVTREQVHLLDHLRNQLKIKNSDHEKIMGALADEERAMLSNSANPVNAEKRLQLATYSSALRKYFQKILAAQGNPDNKFIRGLRAEYGVTRAEHQVILDELMGGEGGMGAQMAEALRLIARAELTVKALELWPSPTLDFLAQLIRARHSQAVESLIGGLRFTLPDERSLSLRLALYDSDEGFRESVIEQLRASLSPAVAERLIAAYSETVRVESSMSTVTEMLAARLKSTSPYVRAVALFGLSERAAANAQMLATMSHDEHELVRETARDLTARSAPGNADTHPELSVVEKMIALRSAPVFANLEPQGLAELAWASREDYFAPGALLCAAGEPGEAVFIVLRGEVEVIDRDDAGERIVSHAETGGFIGELSVLDPGPRSAELRAGQRGTRVLRLNGNAFREAMEEEPAIASQVIRTLAQRLRRK
jgi:Cyclic nucleotide-binding domain